MLKIYLAFWKSEPQYAYKRYAYKKTCMYIRHSGGHDSSCKNKDHLLGRTRVVHIQIVQVDFTNLVTNR